MTATLKINGAVTHLSWQDDQLLDPLADVVPVVLVESLIQGYPRTSIPAPGTNPASTPVPAAPDVSTMNKQQLRSFAAAEGIDSGFSADVWKLPLSAIRQAIAEALRLNAHS